MSEITQADALVRAGDLRNDVFADDVVTVIQSGSSWPAEPKLAATSPPSPHSALKTRINALNGLPRDSLARYASEGWWAWEDLNFRPHAYQARALTN